MVSDIRKEGDFEFWLMKITISALRGRADLEALQRRSLSRNRACTDPLISVSTRG
jgi:hypothetical protein